MIKVKTKTKDYIFQNFLELNKKLSSHKDKILEITIIKGFLIHSGIDLFNGMRNLHTLEVDKNSFENVKNFIGCFEDCKSLNHPLEFNIKSGTSLMRMFKNASSFNSKVFFENSEKIDNVSQLFYGCSLFNQEIKIESKPLIFFSGILHGCSNFNQKINININLDKTKDFGWDEDELKDCINMSLENKVYNYEKILDINNFEKAKQEYQKHLFYKKI